MSFRDLLATKGSPVKRGKREHLFRQGEKESTFYYVNSGILKCYYTLPDGREYIKDFVASGEFAGSLTAGTATGLCSFSAVTVTASDLIQISMEDVKHSCLSCPEVAMDMMWILAQFATKLERREFELLCLSPEERYRRMLIRSGELVDKVTQQDMALYLGLTPVGLSRIKKRMRYPASA